MTQAHEILGVSAQANQQEIKKAYKQLAKKFHPDVNQDPKAAEEFRNIQSAYEQLTGKRKKSRQASGPFKQTYTKPHVNTPPPPKTDLYAKGLPAWLIFVLVLINGVGGVYLFFHTLIQPIHYIGAVFMMCGFIAFFLGFYYKRHYTYALFFSIIYGLSLIHIFLWVNFMFSAPLPPEMYSYQIQTKLIQTQQGPLTEMEHVLHLENQAYQAYPQIRMVATQVDAFYAHEKVRFIFSKGCWGLKILKNKEYVR